MINQIISEIEKDIEKNCLINFNKDGNKYNSNKKQKRINFGNNKKNGESLLTKNK